LNPSRRGPRSVRGGFVLSNPKQPEELAHAKTASPVTIRSCYDE
jgi:hypothetical protein